MILRDPIDLSSLAQSGQMESTLASRTHGTTPKLTAPFLTALQALIVYLLKRAEDCCALRSRESFRFPYLHQGRVIMAQQQNTYNCKQSCQRRYGRIELAYALWRIESLTEQCFH
jgi:hypothetical protein